MNEAVREPDRSATGAPRAPTTEEEGQTGTSTPPPPPPGAAVPAEQPHPPPGSPPPPANDASLTWTTIWEQMGKTTTGALAMVNDAAAGLVLVVIGVLALFLF